MGFLIFTGIGLISVGTFCLLIHNSNQDRYYSSAENCKKNCTYCRDREQCNARK